MGNYIDINGDPNDVRATGAMIRALAESFGAEVQGVLSEINSLDSTRPWGSDSFGQQFERESYMRSEGDAPPASEVVKARMADAGAGAVREGDRTIRAMDSYQIVDTEGGQQINAVRV